MNTKKGNSRTYSINNWSWAYQAWVHTVVWFGQNCAPRPGRLKTNYRYCMTWHRYDTKIHIIWEIHSEMSSSASCWRVDLLTSTWPRVSVCGGDMVPRCDLCSAGTPGSVVWDTCSGDHRQGGRQDATDRYTNTISRWCGYHHPSIIVCCDGMGPILMTCDVSQITLPSSAFSRTWLGQYQRWYYFTCLNNKQYLGW